MNEFLNTSHIVHKKKIIHSPLEYKSNGNSKGVGWPIKLRMSKVKSTMFDGVSLAIVSDCSAFLLHDLFRDQENAVVCLSACPKYDGQDFIDKLTVILEHNNLRKLTFYQMHEECCLVSNSTIECLIKRIKNRTFSVHVNIISRYGQVISELSIN